MVLLCLGTQFENPVGNVVGTLFEKLVGPLRELCLKILLVNLLRTLLGTLVQNSVEIPVRNPGTGGNPAEGCPVLPRNLYYG